MITPRSIGGADFGGDLGAIRHLNAPESAMPAPSYAVTLRVSLAATMTTFPRPVAADGKPAPARGDFNNDVSAAAALYDSIAKGLADHSDGYSPTLVSFDWPSAGKPFPDLPDRRRAKTAIDMVNAGVRPLLTVQTQDCICNHVTSARLKKVHVRPTRQLSSLG